MNEPIIPNHPLSCYTSRKIDYSAKLNEILSQRELSSKITINDIENNDEIIISSESLGNYFFIYFFFDLLLIGYKLIYLI